MIRNLWWITQHLWLTDEECMQCRCLCYGCNVCWCYLSRDSGAHPHSTVCERYDTRGNPPKWDYRGLDERLIVKHGVNPREDPRGYHQALLVLDQANKS